MKTKVAITAITLAGALQIGAAEQPLRQPMSASLTIEKQQPRITTPLTRSKSKETWKIERYGKMSSPWTQTVGWHPNASISERENAEIHESQLHLGTINF